MASGRTADKAAVCCDSANGRSSEQRLFHKLNGLFFRSIIGFARSIDIG
ncbi:MAG: hypothetical protein ACI93B_001984, partial [Yoonia sp.]